MSTILFVVSAARSWTLADGTTHPTGFWAEELLTPYRLLTAAGHRIDIATPGGRLPVADPASLRDGDAEALAAIPGLDSPLVLSAVDVAAYDAVFYPGGHGPMEDLAVDADSAALVSATLTAERPLALVCHGLAALLPARTASGEPVVAGRRLTAFSDEEERQGGLADRAPFLLESALRAQGAAVVVTEPWGDHVLVDGALITGQNPQSSGATANALLEALA
ncbi:type 1 glutamine amidotransferase domain-containing protein [Zhihengliuella sp. ISTPL4]|uniref:type 1 glutamine amidotransferase domain-containing protein n=1 Tax=Zhihengliuella sp. ISTPL4 TaxID=2058657 RepID=UPI000C7A403F|nr:type 1 glutamine amidotransferase domain-containing protein [Zhihengliuella sp. ISTPL4]